MKKKKQTAEGDVKVAGRVTALSLAQESEERWSMPLETTPGAHGGREDSEVEVQRWMTVFVFSCKLRNAREFCLDSGAQESKTVAKCMIAVFFLLVFARSPDVLLKA